MCEDFICVEVTEDRYEAGSVKHVLPEPCYEHLNCQICELMYACDFCATKGDDRCKYYLKESTEQQKTKRVLKKNR